MAAPAWDTISQEINCPLCEYNLRGLTGDRCPECGHQFNLQELLEAKQNEHPFLIEHGRRGLFGRYRKTFRTSIGVRGLWQTVRPLHRLSVGRLVAYKLSQLAMMLAGLLLFFVMMIAYEVSVHASSREQLARRYSYNSTVSQDTVQKMVNQQLPWPSYPTFITKAWDEAKRDSSAIIIILVAMLFWPWVLFVAQFVFMESLRRKQIRRAHLLRCAVYSSDIAVFWIVPFLLAFVGCVLNNYLIQHDRLLAWGNRRWGNPFDQGMRWSLVLMLLWLTWRLVQAYRQYLRFPHAAASAIGAAIITILTLLLILNLLIRNFWWRLGVIDWMIYFK